MTMPTSSSPSTTGSEPTFSEAMSFAAWLTGALPVIVVGFSVIESRTVVLCMCSSLSLVTEEAFPRLERENALGELDAFDRHGLDGPVASV